MSNKIKPRHESDTPDLLDHHGCVMEPENASLEPLDPSLSPIQAGLTKTHEVFSKKHGWIDISEIKTGNTILCFNRNTGKSYWSKVLDTLHFKYSGRICNFYSQYLDMWTTENYYMVYRDNKTNNPLMRLATKFKNYRAIAAKFLCQIPKVGSENKLDYYDKLMIALQADGYIYKNSQGIPQVSKTRVDGKYTHEDSYAYRMIKFEFVKERKIERLKEILDHLDLEYKTKHGTASTSGSQTTNFYIKMPATHGIYKYFKDWVDLTNRGHEWYHDFINECVLWDGSVPKGKRTAKDGNGYIVYNSSEKENAEVVYTIGVLAGYRVTFAEYETSANRKTTYRVTFVHKDLPRGLWKNSCIVKDIDIYNLEVKSGYYVIRKNHKATIATAYKFPLNS